MNIGSIIIDSTSAVTDLCLMGKKYGTDKSPYNTESTLHKHGYTAIYNMLFSPLRYNNITIGEAGILDNKSMLMWREYFPIARLWGFEWFDDKLNNAIKQNLPETKYTKMDIKDSSSITTAFRGTSFDILIEDTTHQFEDQIRFINHTWPHIKPGGMLIIEDIFLSASEDEYKYALYSLSGKFSSATFITANHQLKHSPGWNNDKLLILYRNNK